METKTIDLINTDHWNLYITAQTFVGVGVGFNIEGSDGFSFAIVIPFIAIGIIYIK